MKKILSACAAFGAGLSVFAEGTPPQADISTIVTAVQSFATTALAAVTPIAVGFVAFFLLRLGVRIVKGIASSAK